MPFDNWAIFYLRLGNEPRNIQNIRWRKYSGSTCERAVIAPIQYSSQSTVINIYE